MPHRWGYSRNRLYGNSPGDSTMTLTSCVFTVLKNLKTAPLKDQERKFVSKFDGRPRKYTRKDALYLDDLAKRYGGIRLSPYDIPFK
jgi:hypothetical protein